MTKICISDFVGGRIKIELVTEELSAQKVDYTFNDFGNCMVHIFTGDLLLFIGGIESCSVLGY